MQEPTDENKTNPSEYAFTCESGKVSNDETFRVSAFSGSQSIGKGSLAIMFSQVLFLGFNFLLRYFLAQNVTPADVDIYHLVVSVLIMSFQRIIHYGLPVAVSKYLSEDPAYLGYFMKKGLKLQIYFSLILFVISVAITPLVVVAVNNKSIVMPYILGCISIPFFAIYNIRLCILNGLRRFYQEAFTMTAYGLFRLVLVVIMVYLFADHALDGAIFSNTFAAILGLAIAWMLTRVSFGYREDKHMLKDIINFVGPNILSILLLHILMNIDMFIINRYFATNLNPAGYYSQASFLALLPFVLFNALYATIFPNIVHEISRGAVKKAREIVTFSTRVIAIVQIPICMIIWGSAGEIIRLFNPPEYMAASLSLSVLVVSISLFTLFMNLGVITVAGGHPRKFTSSFIFLLPLGVVLNLLIVPFCATRGVHWQYGSEKLMWHDIGGSEVLISVVWTLTGAAIASGLTAFAGCLYLGLHVQKHFKGIFDFKTALRAFLAAIPAYIFVYFVHMSGIMILVELMIAFLIYAVAIVAAGEFKRDELKTIFGRFKKN